jgi:hypothetical protein
LKVYWVTPDLFTPAIIRVALLRNGMLRLAKSV